MFPQGFLGVFVSVGVTLLMEGQVEEAVALVNLCLSLRQLGCCKHFGLWSTDGQLLRPKESSKQILMPPTATLLIAMLQDLRESYNY